MVAAVSVLALTGCNSGHHVKSRSRQASEPVVYATAVTSPDGKRIAGRDTQPQCHRGRSRQRGAQANDLPLGSPRDHRRLLLGLAPPDRLRHRLLGQHDRREDAPRPPDRERRRRLRHVPEGRWVAWQSGGFDGPSTVGIVSVNGDKNCGFVPRPPNWQDAYPFFKRGVNRLFFTREPYSSATDEPKGPSRVMSVPTSSLCH